MRGDQVSLDEMAGSLAIPAEEYRDTKVEDDRQRVPEHRIRMRLTPVSLQQDI